MVYSRFAFLADIIHVLISVFFSLEKLEVIKVSLGSG